MAVSSSERRVTRLADPALIASLSDFVRARVPGPEVDDIVQSTLAEALAADRAPEDEDGVAAWVHGIARHKVVDWYRRGRRETLQDPTVVEAAAAAEGAPESARDLLRWAHRELPDGSEHQRTLEWMLREGEGEKLESIAADEALSAPRVRQRVSRLRRHYRARWAAEIAGLAALLAVAIAIAVLTRGKKDEIAPLPSPMLVPSAPLPAPTTAPSQEERAAALRRDAFDECDAGLWKRCSDHLDEAARLDPAGDTDARVRSARRAVERALAPAPSESQSPPSPPIPTSTSVPRPTKANKAPSSLGSSGP